MEPAPPKASEPFFPFEQEQQSEQRTESKVSSSDASNTSYEISRRDLELLIEVRKTFSYLVNETSEGRHFKTWAPDFDRLINRLVGFDVYDVPDQENE